MPGMSQHSFCARQSCLTNLSQCCASLHKRMERGDDVLAAFFGVPRGFRPKPFTKASLGDGAAVGGENIPWAKTELKDRKYSRV